MIKRWLVLFVGMGILGVGYARAAEPSKARKSTDVEISNSSDSVKLSGQAVQVSTPASPQDLVPAEAFTPVEEADRFLHEGHPDQAETLFENVLRSSPTAPGALEGLAEARLALNDLRGAEQSARTVLERNKKNPEGWVLLARVAYARKDYKQVLKDCSRALRYAPHHSQAYFWRGKAFDAQGEPDEAKNEYHAATLCDRREDD